MSSPNFSEPALTQMHETMTGFITRKEVPGMVTLLSRNGETHLHSYGTKLLGSDQPVTRDTIFRITSMTKPITTVATLLLVEEGKIRLEESVEKWLPELAHRKVLKKLDSAIDETVPANRAITIHDLLTFRLGFGMIMASPDQYPILKAIRDLELVGVGAPDRQAPYTPDEWMTRLGTLPLMAQPGEKWMYGMGSYLLGVLIARVSGMSLENFFKERIFNPLGMKDTSFSVPDENLKRLSGCYSFDSENKKLEPAEDFPQSAWTNPPSFLDAGAGLVSTIDDYFLFAQMLLRFGKYDGDRSLLSKRAIQMMCSDQLTSEQKKLPGFAPDQWKNNGFGFGVSIVTDPESPHTGQYGWDGGFGSSWRNDPKNDLIGIILTERTFDSPKLPPACEAFWKSVYQTFT